MADGLTYLQEEILSHLRSEFAQPVYEEAVPNYQTVKRNSTGQVKPYLCLQFGDVFAGGSRSMIGALGHDYVMPLSIQVLAPTPEIGRQLSNKLIKVLLGKQFENSGQIEKRPVGGAIMTISESDAASEVYMVPSWYKVMFGYYTDLPTP